MNMLTTADKQAAVSPEGVGITVYVFFANKTGNTKVPDNRWGGDGGGSHCKASHPFRSHIIIVINEITKKHTHELPQTEDY